MSQRRVSLTRKQRLLMLIPGLTLVGSLTTGCDDGCHVVFQHTGSDISWGWSWYLRCPMTYN